MNFRRLFLVLSLFGGVNLVGAQFDYAMSEQGQRSVVFLADAKNPSYIGLVAVGLGSLGLTAAAIVVPTVLCQGSSVHNLICGAVGVATGIVGGASGIVAIAGTVYWTKKIYASMVPHTRRKYFAKLINAAYDYLDPSSLSQAKSGRRLETFIMSHDISYKTTYVVMSNPIQTLAEKLVLANEAGRFSCWSAMFPENAEVGLGKYNNSYGRPKINFPKDHWEDADLNQIVFINVSCLLDENDESFSREKLLADISTIREHNIRYEELRSQCTREAKEFLSNIEQRLITRDDSEFSVHVEYY